MASLWRAGTKLTLLASALGGGGAAALIATSDDPATALKLSTTIPRRLFDDAVAAANIVYGTLDLTEPSFFPKFIQRI
jgi:aarF domain-containing kinase